MNPINKWANGLNDFVKKQTKNWLIKEMKKCSMLKHTGYK
jgi:hypothetical protein